jgi:DNA (cytosine-5)-methyltransferase 1
VTAKRLTTSQERQDYDTQDFVVKAFAQNTRDEVRYLGPNGEGDHTGALASQPGMKQTTYMHERQGVRRLTPVECERLQGFPDGWTITDDTPWQEHPKPDGPRYAQMGNAVTVPVAEWIGRRIMEHGA